MTTQRDQLLALLADFNIQPEPSDPPDANIVTLQAGKGGVKGYTEFFCEFAFDSQGNFDEVSVWE